MIKAPRSLIEASSPPKPTYPYKLMAATVWNPQTKIPTGITVILHPALHYTALPQPRAAHSSSELDGGSINGVEKVSSVFGGMLLLTKMMISNDAVWWPKLGSERRACPILYRRFSFLIGQNLCFVFLVFVNPNPCQALASLA